MVYGTKLDILGVAKFLRPEYTVNDISDDLIFLSDVDIATEFMRIGQTVPVSGDASGLLKAAELCFYMEHCGMVRETENAFGVVGVEKIGNYTKKYENGMPMFFFARGSNEPFLRLLPHETWRMRGYKYVNAYIQSLAYITGSDGSSIYGAIGCDYTARGTGWDTLPSDITGWDAV